MFQLIKRIVIGNNNNPLNHITPIAHKIKTIKHFHKHARQSANALGKSKSITNVQQRDQNGKLLRRGDHICRQGGVGGKVQHGIYVGDADDRHVIFFKAHRAPGAKGAWSKLGFGSFDEFAGVEAAAPGLRCTRLPRTNRLN